MNCHDFQQTWNLLLDENDAAEPVSLRLNALRAHAEACTDCRRDHARYEALRRAIVAWSARPRPTPETADRILEASAPPAPTILPITPRRRSFAAAAALGSGTIAAAILTAVFLPAPTVDAPGRGPAFEPVSLSLAVADARDASWRLARDASEPAARFGLAMLDASLDTDASSTSDDESPDDEVAPEELAPAILDRVGDYAAAGARPLSDAARQAFGFLRSPNFEQERRPAPSPDASKGA